MLQALAEMREVVRASSRRVRLSWDHFRQSIVKLFRMFLIKELDLRKDPFHLEVFDFDQV